MVARDVQVEVSIPIVVPGRKAANIPHLQDRHPPRQTLFNKGPIRLLHIEEHPDIQDTDKQVKVPVVLDVHPEHSFALIVHLPGLIGCEPLRSAGVQLDPTIGSGCGHIIPTVPIEVRRTQSTTKQTAERGRFNEVVEGDIFQLSTHRAMQCQNHA